MPIIIVSKHMKFLEINVTKSVKYLFVKNYEKQKRLIERDFKKHHVYRFDKLTILRCLLFTFIYRVNVVSSKIFSFFRKWQANSKMCILEYTRIAKNIWKRKTIERLKLFQVLVESYSNQASV